MGRQSQELGHRKVNIHRSAPLADQQRSHFPGNQHQSKSKSCLQGTNLARSGIRLSLSILFFSSAVLVISRTAFAASLARTFSSKPCGRSFVVFEEVGLFSFSFSPSSFSLSLPSLTVEILWAWSRRPGKGRGTSSMGLHSSRGKSLGFNANQLNELSTTTKSLPMPGGQEGVCHSDGGVEGGKEGGVLVLHQLEQRVVENLSPVHQVFTGQLSLSRILSANQATTLK